MLNLPEYNPFQPKPRLMETLNRIFRTNRARFSVVIAVMLVLLVFLVSLIGWFIKDSQLDQANVDTACNQGELLRDIYLLMLSGNQEEALTLKISLFEKNLAALENNEHAEFESEKVVLLFPEKTFSVKDDLQAVHESWSDFKQTISQGSGISSADLQRKYVNTEMNSDKLIDHLLQRQNGDYEFLIVALLVFVLLSFSALVFGYFFLSKKLIFPLSVLGNIANRISGGDLSTPVQGFGQDEIGLLALSIEQMRASIAQNTRNMEERIASQTHEIRTAFEFSQEIVSHLDFDQLLVSIVTKARNLSRAKEVSLCLKTSENSWIRMHAREGLLERTQEKLAPCMNLAKRNQGCYFFELPLKVRGDVIGFLCALVDEHVLLTDEDMQALSLLANSSAVAIENARLMAENIKQAQSSAQLAERQQIAAELHDSLAQMLSLLKIQMGQALAAKLNANHAQAGFYELMQKIQLNINHANNQVRALISGLSESSNSPVITPSVELEIEDYINEFRTATPLDLSVDIAYQDFPELPPLVLRQIFLIMRETLANITRHAQASRAAVKIALHNDSVVLEVADNGVGFDANTPLNDVHMGLKIMRARAERVDGQLDLISQPGEGTKVIVNIPYIMNGEKGLAYS